MVEDEYYALFLRIGESNKWIQYPWPEPMRGYDFAKGQSLFKRCGEAVARAGERFEYEGLTYEVRQIESK